MFYNENIGTRWITGLLPLPSAWKDFITCLLRSDFGIYLCSVPSRCLLANRFAPALPHSCSAHRELVFPIPHGEQHSWEWSWEQCWEHTLRLRKSHPISALHIHSLSHSRTKVPTLRCAQGLEVPGFSTHALSTSG